MTDHRHLSPFQFQNPDGTAPTLPDFPNLTLHTVEGQGDTTGRDWAKDLGMPTYFEEWEALARLRSDRLKGRLTFVLFDESETQLCGRPRLHPRQIALPTHCGVELAHEGFYVGHVMTYHLGLDALRGELPRRLNLTLPAEIEGEYVLAEAAFYDSPLAEKAVAGVRRGLFSHTCPILWTPDGAPVGTGLLVQVSLVPGDYPGIKNARIVSFVE